MEIGPGFTVQRADQRQFDWRYPEGTWCSLGAGAITYDEVEGNIVADVFLSLDRIPPPIIRKIKSKQLTPIIDLKIKKKNKNIFLPKLEQSEVARVDGWT